jgi:hypothetical protein
MKVYNYRTFVRDWRIEGRKDSDVQVQCLEGHVDDVPVYDV